MTDAGASPPRGRAPSATAGTGSAAPLPPGALPGEPGIGGDLAPPFTAEDEDCRWLFGLNRFGIRPGLSRIRALLADLGHPERSLRSLVVAGTNGKGSTTRLLAAALRAAGRRTLCFTSPHLLRVYERIEIDGRPVAPEAFAAGVRRLRPLVERHEASWFEALTALALDLARRRGVEWACCETGLGGRLDATNALPAEAVLLTSVSLDHARVLGGTLAEIAAEKLGLLKAGAPLFAAVPPGLRAQVRAAAAAAGSPCHLLSERAAWRGDGPDRELRTPAGVRRGLPDWPLPVLRDNTALAVLCLEDLAARGRLRLPPDLEAVLRVAWLPGRFQLLERRPDWILDAAHNSEALGHALDAFLARPGGGRRAVLFGSMQDKELDAAVGERLRACDLVATAPVALPRSRNRAELDALCSGWRLPPRRLLPAADVGGAVAELRRRLEPEDAVLVTGSCFLVAETLWRLGYRDLAQTRAASPAGEAEGVGT